MYIKDKLFAHPFRVIMVMTAQSQYNGVLKILRVHAAA